MRYILLYMYRVNPVCYLRYLVVNHWYARQKLGNRPWYSFVTSQKS
nr:MAG TPA: hypothetical protein [Caudoviricetes sp.]